MARYKISSDYGVQTVEADAIQRDEGFLILVREGQVVAVFLRWDSVILVD